MKSVHSMILISIISLTCLHIPIHDSFSAEIGDGAPDGYGSPLSYGIDVGPWHGGYNTRCAAADFDGDEDIDLVVSYPYGGGAVNTMWGLFLYTNTGKTNADGIPIFEFPQRLEIDEKQFNIPLAYDWNQDSRTDLLINGKVYLTDENGMFSPTPMDSTFPTKTKCLVDWNDDGIIDCLTSDSLADSYRPSPAVWKPGEPPFTDDGIWKGGAMRNTLRLHLGYKTGNKLMWKDQGFIQSSGNNLEVYGEADPTFADWDGDGDLDLLVGAQTELLYYRNTGTRSEPALQRRQRIKVGNSFSLLGLFLRPITFRNAKAKPPDILLAQESGSMTLLRFIGLNKQSIPMFAAEEELQQHKPYLDAGCLSTISIKDWDRDGDPDILSGNSYGEVLLFVNSGTKVHPSFRNRQRLTAKGEPIVIQSGANGSIQGPGEAHFGYTCPVAVDWNRDGHCDLILSDSWGKYTYYQRDAQTGTLQAGIPIRVHGGKIESYKPPWVWWQPTENELVTQWRCQPAVTDWNKDGTYDLISLDSEGYLALYTGVENTLSPAVHPPQRAFLLDNNTPIRITPGLGGRSGRARIIVFDWDKDGKRDIIRGCTHAGDHVDPNYAETERVAVWYRNSGDDRHFEFRGSLLMNDNGISFCGHATSPAAIDWNQDGDTDLLLGTEDGLIYFFDSSILK